MIDQHAAAERITFEKLSRLTEIQNTDTQNLLVPTEIKMSTSEIEHIREYLDALSNIGLDIEIGKDSIIVKSLPVEFSTSNVEELLNDIVNMDIDESKKDLQRLKLDLVATMACHTSIRAGQKLDIPLMKDVYYNLLDCDNPYSCPHGRPIVWKMKLSELDSKFDRTY
jgi:DNA mismatch repair protein MutL